MLGKTVKAVKETMNCSHIDLTVLTVFVFYPTVFVQKNCLLIDHGTFVFRISLFMEPHDYCSGV